MIVDYQTSENRILAWMEEHGSVWSTFAQMGARTGRLPHQATYKWVWADVHGEGRKHSYEMRKAMKQGMTLERALELQLQHVQERGTTLEGYVAYFKPQTLTRYMRIKERWQADTEWLNMLVRVGLLKNTGHPVGDMQTILKNKRFFEQVRTKGVTR